MRGAQRLIVVDPALQGLSGHHFNYNLALAEEATRRAVPHLVLSNQRVAAPALETDLALMPAFQATPYVNLQHLTQHEYDAYVVRRLEEGLTPILADGDLVVFHSLTQANVEGVGLWLARHHPRRAMMAVVLFMFVDYLDFPDEVENAAAGRYRRFFRHCRDLPPERLVLAAEHHEIAADMAAFSGHTRSVGEAPHLKPAAFLGGLPREAPSGRAEPRRIVYLGHFFESRGADLLDEAVARVAARRPGAAVFDIQINATASGMDADRVEAVRQALAARDSVTVHEGPLSTETFYAILGVADIVVMPYTGYYRRAGAGLFYETLALGRVGIVPAASYMARENAWLEGGMVPMAEHSAEALADAMVHALDHFDSLRAQARQAGAVWAAAHSTAAFFDGLLPAPAE